MAKYILKGCPAGEMSLLGNYVCICAQKQEAVEQYCKNCKDCNIKKVYENIEKLRDLPEARQALVLLEREDLYEED